MALQSSGTIDLSDVNVELGNAASTTITLGGSAVRDLFGVASGAISLTNGYGASAVGFVMSNHTTLDIGAKLYPANGRYYYHAEFNATGTQLYLQKAEGRATFNLSTPYSLTGGSSLASMDYYECEAGRDSSLYSQGQGRDVIREIPGTNTVIKRSYDKAYIYGDIHSATGGTLVSTGNMISSSNVTANYGTELTLELDVNGKVYDLRTSKGKFCLTKYASQTSTTMEARSLLDITAHSASGGNMYTYFIALDNTGTTLSIKTRESNTNYVYKMTLSTPFDVSTAGTPVITTITVNPYDVFAERAVMIAYENNTKYLTIDQYGGMRNYSFGTPGDINTVTKDEDAGRGTFGGYQYCCSSIYWLNSGTQLAWAQYNGQGKVWNVSTPYQWKWGDRFTGGNSIAYPGISQDFEVQTYRDSAFNTTGTRFYTNYYSGGTKLGSLNLSTGFDLSTTSQGAQFDLAATPFEGTYSSSHSWYDKDNNKVHFTSRVTSTNGYIIIDLDANGDYTGTYTMAPKPDGFHPTGERRFQPLTSNGEFFMSIEINDLVVYQLTNNFNPLDGMTEVYRGVPQKMVDGSLTNHTGVTIAYVLDNSIFLGTARDTWYNKFDFTIS